MESPETLSKAAQHLNRRWDNSTTLSASPAGARLQVPAQLKWLGLTLAPHKVSTDRLQGVCLQQGVLLHSRISRSQCLMLDI